MRPFTLCLAISLFIPFTSCPLVAQTDSGPPTLFWVSLGLGSGSGAGEDRLALGVDAALQRGGHLFSGRSLFSTEPYEGGGRAAKESAVLYGRVHRGPWHHAAVSAGPAYLRCQRWSICGDRDMPGDKWTYETKIGLAISGQIVWTPLRFFGIGLYGFGNINANGSFKGAMLAVRFGKLR